MIFNQILNQRNVVKACNYNDLITTQSTNGTWKASKDCWIVGNVAKNSSTTGDLYINNTLVLSTAQGPYSNDDTVWFSLYVKKGSVIKFVGRAHYRAFGCLP